MDIQCSNLMYKLTSLSQNSCYLGRLVGLFYNFKSLGLSKVYITALRIVKKFYMLSFFRLRFLINLEPVYRLFHKHTLFSPLMAHLQCAVK
jgi:hypothetical protein